MWIASHLPKNLNSQQQEALLDLSLSLSPHVACFEQTTLLISLSHLSRYWNLPQLPAALQASSESNSQATLFLEKLRHLSSLFQLRFAMAPTAPWALWAATHETPKHPTLSLYTRDEMIFCLQHAAMKTSSTLVDDVLHQKPHLKAELAYFLEMSRDLGLHTVRDLEPFMHSSSLRESLVQRFGPVVEKILKRLAGSDDWNLEWYEAPGVLKNYFSPRLENMMSTERSELQGPMDTIQSILAQWEMRLEARRAVIGGLCVSIVTNRRQSKHEIVVTCPKATRNAATFYKIFLEKWLKLCADSHNQDSIINLGVHLEDEIDEIELKSLKLENDHDRQLNLFDPHREELDEKWNVLVGQLRARSNNMQNIRIGGYRPFESYFPENSIEWVEWEDWSNKQPSPVQDHPRRPIVLLTKPTELPETYDIQNEDDFLRFVESKNALLTLEKMRDPWRSGQIKAQTVHFDEAVAERSYARVDGHWLFWDHAQSKIFLHGHFE